MYPGPTGMARIRTSLRENGVPTTLPGTGPHSWGPVKQWNLRLQTAGPQPPRHHDVIPVAAHVERCGRRQVAHGDGAAVPVQVGHGEHGFLHREAACGSRTTTAPRMHPADQERRCHNPAVPGCPLPRCPEPAAVTPSGSALRRRVRSALSAVIRAIPSLAQALEVLGLYARSDGRHRGQGPHRHPQQADHLQQRRTSATRPAARRRDLRAAGPGDRSAAGSPPAPRSTPAGRTVLHPR
jgi:hypothetical protein